MPQDTFTLRYLSLALGDALAGGRINKIVQPSKDEVQLIVYTGKKTVKLVLNTNASDCGAYFEEGESQAPAVAPNFCMLLRKYIQGAEITAVELIGFERILLMRMRGSTEFATEEHRLLLEVMGKYSNLILTDAQNVILGALKTTSLDVSTKRMIFPGVPYAPPAPQEGKVSPADRAALAETLSHASGDLGGYLFSHVAGLAPVTAEDIAANYRGGDLAEYVFEAIFSDMVYPCVVEREGAPFDFYARRMPGATPFCSLLEAESYVYRMRRTKKRFEGEKRKLSAALSAALKKNQKRYAQISEKERECAHVDDLRLKGELLTANLYALSRGMQSCELENWYDPAGGKVKIVLDSRLTPSENAQSYFKRYRKQKRTLEVLAPQKSQTEEELAYLASMETALRTAETEEDLASLEEEWESAGLLKAPEKKKKARTEIPYRTYEMGGFSILAGRNNLQNDRLVRSASPDDMWLHAQRYHSCHVVIRTNGRKVPAEVLQFAANICARFSQSSDRVPVDACAVKYVRKPKGSKAGFVTYTDFITLAGDPKQAP